MALNNNIKVPMPEHGVVKRRMGDKIYVYYATATYRNKKGQPTCDRVSIGKFDVETGMLIPNRSYYEIYLKKSIPVISGVRDFGVNYAFENIVKNLGLVSILKKYFPENYKELLTISQYMLSEGNVLYYLEDYSDTHKTSLDGGMSSAKSSRVFSSVRNEDILLFLREWMNKNKTDEYVAYDVTSFSSYSKNIDELEWGYNRDKERMPQINMGMYYGESSKLPLYYRIYPGSISDKTHLKYMVSDDEFINCKKMRFVMDRGFYSADNLRFLVQRGYRFVIALPNNLKYCNELIKKHKEEIVNHSEFMLGKGLPYGKDYIVTELGFRMKVHMYYDADKALRESEALYELIERQENELKLMEEPPDKKFKYDKYFYINRSKDGKLGFRKNYTAIDEHLSRCGFFFIAETDFDKSSAEILEIYRNRDVIEKSFDSLKNEVDMKRLRCHNTETTIGKMFTAFISLVVRSYMTNKLSTYMANTGYTFKKIINELDKIKCFEIKVNTNSRLLNPVSKVQRDILEAMDVIIPN